MEPINEMAVGAVGFTSMAFTGLVNWASTLTGSYILGNIIAVALLGAGAYAIYRIGRALVGYWKMRKAANVLAAQHRAQEIAKAQVTAPYTQDPAIAAAFLAGQKAQATAQA